MEERKHACNNQISIRVSCVVQNFQDHDNIALTTGLKLEMTLQSTHTSDHLLKQPTSGSALFWFKSGVHQR